MGTKQNREIALFDPMIPLESAHAPPYTWYTSQEVFDTETAAIFQKSWLCVGRTDQVNRPGKFFSGSILGNPYVVVRGEDGVLRAFHNVCSHKGCELAPKQGSCAEFVCAYHGWTYKHNGELSKIPHLGKQDKGFNISLLNLKPMSVREWGPLIFVDLDGSWSGHDKDCRKLEDDLEPIKIPLEDMGFSKMRHVERRIYNIDCNWKVFVDNGLDGGYHVAYAHEKLAQGLDFAGYRTEIFPRSSFQICESNKSDARLGDKVIYAWAFPNLFINRYGRCMDINVVIPVSPDRCRVVIDWYFDYDDFEDWHTSKIIKHAISDSDSVQQEDIEVCESVQRGMNSMAFQEGRYSSKLEQAVHAFHVLLWRELYGRS